MELKLNQDIVLRSLEKEDAKAIFETIDSQRDYLGKWLPFVENSKVQADTEKFVSSAVDAPEDLFEHIFTIRKSGQFIGIIGFKGTDRANKKTEIGYWLSENEQKQGIITNSVKKLCIFAFEEMRMNRIQIKVAVGNEASKKIPKRLGFFYEGIERDGELLTGKVYTDIEVYSLLKREAGSNSKF